MLLLSMEVCSIKASVSNKYAPVLTRVQSMIR
jgi:hypothetical protein